jgi:PhoH-like ATPase
MSRMTVVLDTSVLVADPGAVHTFDGQDVVIPLTVIEELDGHKTRRDDVGAAAREALRSIEGLRNAHDGDIATAVELANGATVRVETNGVHLEELRGIGLDPTKADNRILAACCGLRANGSVVTVVTNDTAMRIKASQLGFIAAEHTRANRSVIETGYGAWPVLEVSGALLTEVHHSAANGIVFASIDGDDRTVTELDDNSFGVLRAGTSSLLVRSIDKSIVELPAHQEAYGLRPRSKEQKAALALLLDPEVTVVALDGTAGTGKTILALAAGLEQVVERHARYERLAVYRPIVPVGHADLGFLPGTLDEKLEPWMAAVVDALAALTDDGSYLTAQEVMTELIERRKLTMESVTFLRGRTLQSSFIVVDEAQNLEPTTVKTILTRVGDGAKIVFCGDRDQIDAPYLSKHNNGLAVLLDAFRGQRCFGGVRLASCERSEVAALAAQLL